jgi:Fe-S-cluster containining protein
MMKIPLEVEQAVGAMRVARDSVMAAYTRRLVRLRSTCQRGCSYCCYWPVAISVLEGADIVLHLRRNRRWTSSMQEALTKAADVVTGLDYAIWLQSQTACVFLNKAGECSIYEARPLSCRTIASEGDPERCHPSRMAAASCIVPRTDDLAGFYGAEQAILKHAGAEFHTMPIPTAILVANRLCSGEFLLSQAGKATFIEHIGRVG